MKIEEKVLGPEQAPLILEFEKHLLEDAIPDPMEREMASWHAPWRSEALEHYLPLGWSFYLYPENQPEQILGYLLAQPLLYFRSNTQTLWVEHLQSREAQYTNHLVDIAYKWCRDKHLQRLMIKDFPGAEAALAPMRTKKLEDRIWEVATAKDSGF